MVFTTTPLSFKLFTPIKNIVAKFREPSKTKSHKWAIANNAETAYLAGYDAKWKCKEESPNPYLYDQVKKRAYELGIEDADFDIHWQR